LEALPSTNRRPCPDDELQLPLPPTIGTPMPLLRPPLFTYDQIYSAGTLLGPDLGLHHAGTGLLFWRGSLGPASSFGAVMCGLAVPGSMAWRGVACPPLVGAQGGLPWWWQAPTSSYGGSDS